MTPSSPVRRHLRRRAAVGAAVILALSGCGDPESVIPSASPGGTTAPITPGTAAPATTEPEQPEVPETTVGAPPPIDQAFDPVALRAELEAARQRWAEQDVRSYTFEYSLNCFCPQIVVRVAVIEGRLVETSLDSLDAGFSDDSYVGLTVEDWFDEIDQAVDTAYNVTVTYTELGYPDSVYIDVDQMMADEEYGMAFESLADQPAPIADIVNQPYPCGYGFWTATPTQGVALHLGFNEEPAIGTYDVSDLDLAELQLGKNLMANWCNDVATEPAPEITETWAITAGTLDITVVGEATARITGLVATTPDGTEIPLGDSVITNDNWGMFAG